MPSLDCPHHPACFKSGSGMHEKIKFSGKHAISKAHTDAFDKSIKRNN
jgi:hypothetical protein